MSLKRLSEEEAKQYVAVKDDYTGRGLEIAKYFTITPSSDPEKAKEGWEDVTYYTSRKLNKYSNKEGEYDSWVYVLSNPTMPGTYKIGYTAKEPETRAKELSNATGVALPYQVEWAYHCFNGLSLEGEVHRYLDEYRVNTNREFFAVGFDEIKEVVENLGKKYI